MERVELCEGAECRRVAAGGGGRLCATCQARLAADIRALPRLYDSLGQILGGGRAELRERTSGGHLPGMPFNAAASEARSAIHGVLCSWAAMVAEERAVTPPARTVRHLADFLVRHLAWLAGHDAVADLTVEMARLARRGRRIADPDPVRRVPVGACAEPGCSGTLIALLRPGTAAELAEIRCDVDPAHQWAAHEWTRLGRRLRGLTARPAGSQTGRVAWLTAAEISRLWDISSGSVYRLASEHRWRRRSRGGRAYYHEDDVTDALREREPRSA
ncbi:hypothetical protein [Streptomyces sp. 8N616]|uniref:hypothetical protein n=1 Tax=Streptomyces sp. 8N616 TaxID=3457414 RepID=UPI003FD370F8